MEGTCTKIWPVMRPMGSLAGCLWCCLMPEQDRRSYVFDKVWYLNSDGLELGPGVSYETVKISQKGRAATVGLSFKQYSS